MEINVEFDIAGGTAKLDGTLSKDEVEFIVKYGLYQMLSNGVIPVTDVVPSTFVEGNDTVN